MGSNFLNPVNVVTTGRIHRALTMLGRAGVAIKAMRQEFPFPLLSKDIAPNRPAPGSAAATAAELHGIEQARVEALAAFDSLRDSLEQNEISQPAAAIKFKELANTGNYVMEQLLSFIDEKSGQLESNGFMIAADIKALAGQLKHDSDLTKKMHEDTYKIQPRRWIKSSPGNDLLGR